MIWAANRSRPPIRSPSRSPAHSPPLADVSVECPTQTPPTRAAVAGATGFPPPHEHTTSIATPDASRRGTRCRTDAVDDDVGDVLTLSLVFLRSPEAEPAGRVRDTTARVDLQEWRVRYWLTGLLLALLAAQPGAQSAIKLVDVAGQAGLNLVNVSGGPAKDYIVDANGNGAAFFDYDND